MSRSIPAAVLFVAQRKYGERQAGIEPPFQALSQPLPPVNGGSSQAAGETAEMYYSRPEDTVIPLSPLVVVMIVLSCMFGTLAIRTGFHGASKEMIAK